MLVEIESAEDANEHASSISSKALSFRISLKSTNSSGRPWRGSAKKRSLPSRRSGTTKASFRASCFAKAGALGLFGIRIDPKWGGSGLDWWATAAYR